VLRAVVSRFDISAPSPAPEHTGRRSITFSPKGGATVVLRHREPAPAAQEAARSELALA